MLEEVNGKNLRPPHSPPLPLLSKHPLCPLLFAHRSPRLQKESKESAVPWAIHTGKINKEKAFYKVETNGFEGEIKACEPWYTLNKSKGGIPFDPQNPGCVRSLFLFV